MGSEADFEGEEEEEDSVEYEVFYTSRDIKEALNV